MKEVALMGLVAWKGIVKRGAVVWLGALSVAGGGDVGSVEKGKTTSAV